MICKIPFEKNMEMGADNHLKACSVGHNFDWKSTLFSLFLFCAHSRTITAPAAAAATATNDHDSKRVVLHPFR